LESISERIEPSEGSEQGDSSEHVCPSCKLRVIDKRFERCAGCYMKWKSVYESCLAHGWPDDLARCRATSSYPSMRGAVEI